jgi:putative membrane protein
LERRVELIADQGINQKISQSQWDAIVKHIIQGIQQNKLIPHLCESIENCGKLLTEHFPIKTDDTNELKNELVILES